ncbi:MAG: CDP-alcohol phosphatidyltransferase family protein [Lachnospiraceae bacterium]
MKKYNRKEFLSIPNCMGYFRLILIPVFCILYLRAELPKDYYIAALVLLVSSLTDALDGFVARRFNMITEFGKLLDPVADKLTHAAIAVCLMFRYPNMKYLFVLMIIKEGFMAVMGLWNLKHGEKLDGAKWFGKFCTASLFCVMLVLVAYPKIALSTANLLIFMEMAIMLLTLILYIPQFYKMRKKWDS